MKKTVTINIRGIVFTIDEDAYDILQNYLNTIKSYFNDSNGRDEIMGDIEARIAEMFQEKVTDKNQVINLENVEAMISIMGKPEDFVDDETKAESEQKHYKSSSKTYYTNNKNKRLFRDKDSNILGGVCSGIGYYFGFDPIWLRLIFAISFFAFGSGFLFYLLLWIIIPEAKTAAEKLEMKGEPVNIDNIGRTIEDEMDNVKQRFNNFKNDAKTQNLTDKFKSAIQHIFLFIFNLITLLIKTVGKIIGGIIMVVGIFIVIFLLNAFIGDGNTITSITPDGINSFSFKEWGSMIFGTEIDAQTIYLGLALLIGIPAIAIIYGGLKLLFGMKQKIKGVGAILTILWFIGLAITIYSGLTVASNYKAEDEISETMALTQIIGDTLILTLDKDVFNVPSKKKYRSNKNIHIKIENDKIYMGNTKFTIVKSKDQFYNLEIIKSSKGSSSKEARQIADAIEYNFNIENNTLILPPYYSFDTTNSWRNQKLGIILHVPEGKAVYLDKDMARIIYDINNVSNTYDPDMVGKTWTMLAPGLTCIGCNQNEL